MLDCAKILLWSHCEVVSIQFRWMGHGSESNDEIVSHRYFVRYWFRLHSAFVRDPSNEVAQKEVMGRVIERLGEAGTSSFLLNTKLIN